MRNFIILLALISLLLVGCKKEEEGSLNGTVWKYTEVEGKYKHESILVFGETSFTAKSTETYGGEVDGPYTDSGTYTYSHPTVTLYLDSDGSTAIGIISGNQLQMTSGDNFTFVKQ